MRLRATCSYAHSTDEIVVVALHELHVPSSVKYEKRSSLAAT
jgi:hypothetical protein